MATIQTVYDTLDDQLTASTKLLTDIAALRPPATTHGYPGGLPQLQLNMVYELAFLRCFLSWEAFLEDAFLAYAMGRSGLSGRTPRRLVQAKSFDAAAAAIRDDRRFAEWVDVDRVMQRAESWFSPGDPFTTVLPSAKTDIAEMLRVRNRIAHNSGRARASFSNLCEDKYTNPNDRRGMGPGAFLARPEGSNTRLVDYADKLRGYGHRIATN